LKRFEAYGWHTLHVKDGDHDVDAMEKAIEEAKAVKDKPTIIKLTTTIGFGSKAAGTGGVHGNPLKPDDAKQVKQKLYSLLKTKMLRSVVLILRAVSLCLMRSMSFITRLLRRELKLRKSGINSSPSTKKNIRMKPLSLSVSLRRDFPRAGRSACLLILRTSLLFGAELI